MECVQQNCKTLKWWKLLFLRFRDQLDGREIRATAADEMSKGTAECNDLGIKAQSSH